MKPFKQIMLSRSIIALLFFMVFSTSQADIFGPSNYEDCVLQGLKEAKTDSAVAVLMGICRSKFNKPEKTKDKQQDGTAGCLLYWDGIKTTKLTSEPKDWRNNFIAYSINKYNIEFAIIYVPKTFNQTKDAETEMWQIANNWCK